MRTRRRERRRAGSSPGSMPHVFVVYRVRDHAHGWRCLSLCAHRGVVLAQRVKLGVEVLEGLDGPVPQVRALLAPGKDESLDGFRALTTARQTTTPRAATSRGGVEWWWWGGVDKLGVLRHGLRTDLDLGVALRVDLPRRPHVPVLV